jgi:acyl-coenzyme A thioesterase PaaI-like protein
MPASTRSNCFGCAQDNPIGLKLMFTGVDGTFESRIRLGANYESFPGVVHGGIVAAILDEMLAQAVYRTLGISAFTIGLRVRYGHLMETETDYIARASVSSHDSANAKATARIETASGELVATADGTFFLLTSEAIAAAGPRLKADLARSIAAYNAPVAGK